MCRGTGPFLSCGTNVERDVLPLPTLKARGVQTDGLSKKVQQRIRGRMEADLRLNDSVDAITMTKRIEHICPTDLAWVRHFCIIKPNWYSCNEIHICGQIDDGMTQTRQISYSNLNQTSLTYKTARG